MKREILFRGKRVDNGEWVEGLYFKTTFNTVRAVGLTTCIQVIDDIKYKCFEVVPETVGQFTGLTDKNGKRIFEGDIVNHGNLYTHFTVKWDDKSAMFKHCHEIYTDRVEVIGSIHDNPELL